MQAELQARVFSLLIRFTKLLFQTYLDTKAAPEMARYSKTIAEIREWIERLDRAEELLIAAKKEKRKLKKAKPKEKKEKGKKEEEKTKKKKKKKTDVKKKSRKSKEEKKHTEKPEQQSKETKKVITKKEEKKQRKEKKKGERVTKKKEKAEKKRKSIKERTPIVMVHLKDVDKKTDPPPRDFLKEKREYEESEAFKAFAKTKGPGSTWTRQQVDEAETHLTFLKNGDGMVPLVSHS